LALSYYNTENRELGLLVHTKNKTRARGHYAITAAILRACKERTLRTHVLWLTGITSDMLQEYTEAALRADLLFEAAIDRSLLITDKGRLYLENYEVIEKMLADDQKIPESIS
jgi:predicted transcriptional regulator